MAFVHIAQKIASFFGHFTIDYGVWVWYNR